MATKRKAVRQRIQFAFNADADSAIGGIFQYLIKNNYFSSREGKQKGVDAMIAFYKPFAYQGKEGVDERELRAMAQSSVDVLSRQIELLCSTFGVEQPATIALDLKTQIKQAIAESLTAERIAESIRLHQDSVALSPEQIVSEPQRAAVSNAAHVLLDDALLGELGTNAEAAA